MTIIRQNKLLKVSTLQTIEMVIAGIEQLQLQVVPHCYLGADTQQSVTQAEDSLVQSSKNDVESHRDEEKLFEQLDSWYQSLIERDLRITAFDLRSFCSSALPRFENEIYAALAGFYRNLTPTTLVLSKFDYSITQYFSSETDNNQRVLRSDAEGIVAKLRGLNVEWMGHDPSEVIPKPQTRKAIVVLSKLSQQAKAHKTLKTWLDDEFFSYSREIKRGLSETFFVPEVTTAVILCNLTLGNQFAALCKADSTVLTDAANVFATNEEDQNIISAQLNSSFQTLLYTGLEEEFADTIAQERLSNLFDLISGKILEGGALVHSDEANKILTNNSSFDLNGAISGNTVAETIDFADGFNISITSTLELNPTYEASQEHVEGDLNNANLTILDPTTLITSSRKTGNHVADSTIQGSHPSFSAIGCVLTEIAQFKPNKEIIRDYLRQSVSAEVRELRLDEFLNVGRESGAKNLRRVLRLIVSAEEAIRFLGSSQGYFSTQFQDELHLLNEEIQLVNNRLRRSLNEIANTSKNEDNELREHFETLLYATNTLVETQIRLNLATAPSYGNKQGNVVSYPHKDQQSKVKFEKIKIEDSVYKSPKIVPVIKPVIKLEINKWLLLVVAVIILISGTWFFFSLTIVETPVSNANVKTLDPKELPGSGILNSAKINNNTLFGFVGEVWDTQSLELKKESLRLLLDEGAKNGFDKIFLINRSGKVVGNASKSEIKIL